MNQGTCTIITPLIIRHIYHRSKSLFLSKVCLLFIIIVAAPSIETKGGCGCGVSAHFTQSGSGRVSGCPHAFITERARFFFGSEGVLHYGTVYSRSNGPLNLGDVTWTRFSATHNIIVWIWIHRGLLTQRTACQRLVNRIAETLRGRCTTSWPSQPHKHV